MSNSVKMRRLGAALSLMAVAGFQTGCAPGQMGGAMSTQTSRIGPDDGTDFCRPYLVALDSTGNFFGEQILTGALMGAAGGGLAGGLIGGDWKGALIGAAAGAAVGAATGYLSALQQRNYDQAAMYSQVQGDLSRENAQIDQTQAAFDQLMDCRFRQAAMINADLKAGRMDRATAEAHMALVRQRARDNIAYARQIDERITGRAQQFYLAADNVAPGAATAVTAAVAKPAAKPSKVRQAGSLKLRPDSASPDVGQLAAKQPVTVLGSRNGYALVKTESGQQGYAPADSLDAPVSKAGARSVGTQTPAAAQGADVRTLAGSNAARRDGFSQSVAVSEQAAATGFEVAG